MGVMNFLLMLIDNIWIVAAIIVIACLILLKACGSSLKGVGKFIIIFVIVAAIAIALGLTTSDAIKDAVVGAVERIKDFNFAEEAINDPNAGHFVNA